MACLGRFVTGIGIERGRLRVSPLTTQFIRLQRTDADSWIIVVRGGVAWACKSRRNGEETEDKRAKQKQHRSTGSNAWSERGRAHTATNLIILSGLNHIPSLEDMHHTELVKSARHEKWMGCEKVWDAVGGAPKRTRATVEIASKVITRPSRAFWHLWRQTMYSCRSCMSRLNTSFLPCNLRFCGLTFERHKYSQLLRSCFA